MIVRNPQDLPELPGPVLDAAASLAAWHSKARGSRGKVEVHVCRVADVSKPRGFDPGQVLLRRFKAKRAAWTFFQAQPPSYRHLMTFWVMSAKREDTRRGRFDRLLETSALGQRIR